MNLENYISVPKLCSHYQLEPSFFILIDQNELIQIETINDVQYLSFDSLYKVEKMIRIHKELEVHEENIDIVYNLIQKIETLQQELNESNRRLQVFQIDYDDESPLIILNQ